MDDKLLLSFLKIIDKYPNTELVSLLYITENTISDQDFKECFTFASSKDFIERGNNNKSKLTSIGKSKLMELEKKIDELYELNKLQKENLELQNENLEYKKIIRDQEDRIRVLDVHIKTIDVLKGYWWLLGICIGIGVLIVKLLGKV